MASGRNGRNKNEEGATRTFGRALWKGTITFGLVSVPVELVSTRRAARPRLRMVSSKGTPLRRVYHDQQGRPLDNAELVRGYATEGEKFVTITDEELESLAAEKSQDMVVDAFVPRKQLRPMQFAAAYYLVPGKGSARAYHLLVRTMDDSDRAGVATFVMRDRQHLVALIAENGLLCADTMRFADELRTPEGIGLSGPVKVPAKRRKTFEQLVNELPDEPPWDSMQNEDAAALLKIAGMKADRGHDVVEADLGDDEEGEQVIDLMEVLKERLGSGVKAQPAAKGRTTSRKSTNKKGKRASKGSKSSKSSKSKRRTSS